MLGLCEGAAMRIKKVKVVITTTSILALLTGCVFSKVGGHACYERSDGGTAFNLGGLLGNQENKECHVQFNEVDIFVNQDKTVIYPKYFMWSGLVLEPLHAIPVGDNPAWIPILLVEMALRLPTAPIELLFDYSETQSHEFQLNKPITFNYDASKSCVLENDISNKCCWISVQGCITPISVPFFCSKDVTPGYKKYDPILKEGKRALIYELLCVDTIDGYIWASLSEHKRNIKGIPLVVKISIATGEVIPVASVPEKGSFGVRVDESILTEKPRGRQQSKGFGLLQFFE